MRYQWQVLGDRPKAARVDLGAMATALSIREEFRLDERRLLQLLTDGTWHALDERLADLVTLARAVAVADSRSPRPLGWRSGPAWKREIEVQVQLRASIWTDEPGLLVQLAQALSFITGDAWEFRAGRPIESDPVLEPCLPFRFAGRVCLFSEGMDSLCGLARRLEESPHDIFIPVSIMTRSQTRPRVRSVIETLGRRYGNRLYPLHIPMQRRHAADRIGQEETQRTRSFLLLVVAAVVALLAEQNEVEVYENGIEAFNFTAQFATAPGRTSRAMHPILLDRLSRFISDVVGASFGFVVPFVFETKVEHVRSLPPGLRDVLVGRTVSCMHFPQRRSGPLQCGACTGCLLRQTSLAAAGIVEPSVAYRANLLSTAFREWPQAEYSKTAFSFDHVARAFESAARSPNAPEAVLKLTRVPRKDWRELVHASARVGKVGLDAVVPSLLHMAHAFSKECDTLKRQGPLCPTMAPEEPRPPAESPVVQHLFQRTLPFFVEDAYAA